jgi:hypothetical protein
VLLPDQLDEIDDIFWHDGAIKIQIKWPDGLLKKVEAWAKGFDVEDRMARSYDGERFSLNNAKNLHHPLWQEVVNKFQDQLSDVITLLFQGGYSVKSVGGEVVCADTSY